MPRPAHTPLGLHLTRVSKAASRAFGDALAEAVGVQGATLTHHLNAMESAGLVTRRRDPANRRLHLVELTPEGDALFFRLRDAAMAFDQRLRAGLSDEETAQLEALLTRLRDNVSAAPRPNHDDVASSWS